MSVKHIVIAIAFVLLLPVAASAQPGAVSYHRIVVGQIEFIQQTAWLQGSSSNAAVEAAIQWMVQHSYLTDGQVQSFGPDVTVSGSCITIAFHVPGGPDIVIVLPNGPFLPTEGPPQRLMAITVVRAISNGF